eukprot:TRINITY_DN5603_c0_g1_i5.p1 TRINITY_DN5603_c0_g1~~TRINITY_DN5603_c0_g1_i5.p1  ORF type:complete len:776 (+),score=171.35 TRINITY_DN5603_c0_g1_i5:425-2752(+)
MEEHFLGFAFFYANSIAGELLPEKLNGDDYVLVSKDSWKLLKDWYGGGPAIERKMIIVGEAFRTTVEVYPLKLIIYKRKFDKVMFTMSRNDSVSDLKKFVAMKCSIPPHKINILLNRGSGDWIKVSDDTLNLDEAGFIDDTLIYGAGDPDLTAPMDNYSILTDSDSVASEEKSDSSSSSEEYQARKKYYQTNSTSKKHTTKPQSRYQPSSRTRANIERGVCGLSNLGNTCFMNSALQCLSNSGPLTEYFLAGKHKDEINKENPLGMGGKMAIGYSNLLKKMWKGNTSSVAPSDFKWVVGRFAPQFSGYRQHDSQELLAFLLDGLHEDLNLVLNKPYVEKIDSDGTDDASAASDAWDRHLLRNRSIIVDLFQGQLRSRLQCPIETCKKVSVTFDPYMYLSLPVPVSTHKFLDISVVPMNVEKPVCSYRMKVLKGTRMGEVRELFSELTGENEENFVLAEVSRGYITRIMTERLSIDQIRNNSSLYAYEVTNTDEEDTIHVRVLNRVEGRKTKYSTFYSVFGTPFIKIIPYIKNEFTSVDLYASFEETIRNLMTEEARNLDPEDVYDLYVVSMGTSKGKLVERSDEKNLRFIQSQTFAVTWKDKEYYQDIEREEIEHESMSLTKSKKEVTLDDCLGLYVSEEILGKNDEWYCPECKTHRQAAKKIDLWNTPEILVIHFKRFQATRGYRTKINTNIDFPITGLDLSKYVRHPTKTPIYDLFAVSNHSGGLGGGHYTAYGMNFMNKKWYSFNDSYVSNSVPQNSQTGGAYLLFYRLVGE